MKSLLEKTREINKLAQNTSGRYINFTEIANVLSKNINANIYIFNRKGKIIGYSFMSDFYCQNINNLIKFDGRFPDKYINQLLNITESVFKKSDNCIIKNSQICCLKNKHMALIPILSEGLQIGALQLEKSGKFRQEDIFLAEYCATLIMMESLRSNLAKVNEKERQKNAVKVALKKLSYSELGAMQYLFDEIDNLNSSLLVASRIADKYGITRSVIVNALRKMESAGLIKVSSLGMKGVNIQLNNIYIKSELKNIREYKCCK